MNDGLWEIPEVRITDALRDLAIGGEHTLPDGHGVIRRRPYGGYDLVGPDAAAPAFPDFSSVYELLLEEPTSLIETARACVTDPCPPYVETTIRMGQPVVPPPWVRAALDRIERDWSAALRRIDPGNATPWPGYRVTTFPALAGGYWMSEVPDEPPLMVETLCERCTEGSEPWPL